MNDVRRRLRTDLPGNPRYQPKQLVPYFGYDNLYRTVSEVEIAALQTLGDIGVIPAEDVGSLTEGLIQAILEIQTTEVDKIEREITKHDIRAWVRKAQEIISRSTGNWQVLSRWVHVPLTSYDPIDTGRILQFSRAYSKAIRPLINELILILADLVERFADQIQIGRTHGQHALPITVGFWLATVLSRIIYNTQKLDEHASQLVGKISGAVGAHNAQFGLGFGDRCGDTSFEDRVLAKLGLKPARISTQILPPEPLGYFLFSSIMLSASFGQLGRDGRNLMRSEIAEVIEAFEPGQVGSSTMGQKRNPISWENLEGTWVKTRNEFGKVLDTLISEHQRDLVGSCVARDFPTILVNLCAQLNTLLRQDKNEVPWLARITINADACQANFDQSANTILAEPFYIALQMAGFPGDAHELVKDLSPLAASLGFQLIQIAHQQAGETDGLAEALEAIPPELKKLLGQPERYIGDAPDKAREIAALAREIVA